MKKKTTTKRRPTIGENPLDSLVPVQAAAAASKRGLQPASSPRGYRMDYGAARTGGTLESTEKTTPKRVKKARFTFHLPEDLMERAKNAAYWSSPRVTLASMAEAGLRAELERMEKKNGGAFKGRERELVGGRPIGT
jgi:hypothetical protein